MNKNKKIVQLVCVLIVLSSIECCDFKQYGAEHTMNKYEKQKCALKSSFSIEEKKEILRVHNEYRQNLAKGSDPDLKSATNMMELAWDDEIERVAQRWTDQCKFGHDEKRRTCKYEYVGQNAFIQGTSNDDTVPSIGAKAVTNWYKERELGFTDNEAASFDGNLEKAHYTQVVWAKTEAIGCGFTMYKDGNMYSRVIACNYGPGGNYRNTPMYVAGKPCSSCPSGCSKTYSALCKNADADKKITASPSGVDSEDKDVKDLTESHTPRKFTHWNDSAKDGGQRVNCMTYSYIILILLSILFYL